MGFITTQQARELLGRYQDGGGWRATASENGTQYDRIEDDHDETWGDGDNGILDESNGGLYKNCKKCYDYSTLFGTTHKGRSIKTEEDFEIVKNEFVKHFNECHKDLVKKKIEQRSTPPRRFKKVEKMSDYPTVQEAESVTPFVMHNGNEYNIFPRVQRTWLGECRVSISDD